MCTKIRFMVYNAYGIGGTVKTIFNFANYFQETGKYDVEIISIKRTRETPILQNNSKVKIIALQDARREVNYSDEDRELLRRPSKLIFHEEELYSMFNAYTDKKLKEYLESLHDGVLVTTMPSFNVLATTLVDDRVLKIGQEHKSFADHTQGIQELIRNNYGKLSALTILTERNEHVYKRKIYGKLPIYVLGNGTERLLYRAILKNHVIIAAGRYAKEKGYDMLIKAFGKVASENPDWVLKIYGNGNEERRYLKLVKEYDLVERVILEPATNQLNEKFSEASFQVCSSYREGFGMSIIEGFAMGLPCVSFACDGPREIITDGYDGIIVPKEDIEALAKSMERLMLDEKFRMELGNNAYETSKKYDIHVIGEEFKQIVETELKNKIGNLKELNENEDLNRNSFLVTAPEIRHISGEYKGDIYENMICATSEGKVGFATIWKMVIGWFKYKWNKVVN